MKKFYSRVSAAIMAVAMMATLAACGGAPSSVTSTPTASDATTADVKPITMKLGLTFADGHLITQNLYKMAENVKERTNGGLNIEIYADSLLGKEAEMYEQLHMGTIDMALETIAFQSTTHPELTIEDLPYMFATRQNGYDALDGAYGAKINEIIASDGDLYNLGFMELGYRHVTNNVRPIVTPDDMKGVKIRTTTSDLRLAVFETLGAQPTAMGFSEVFTGLQQNVIDGQESPLSTIDSSSFAEVQKYLSLTGHFWTNECLLINANLWNSIPAEWQAILQEEVDACEARIHDDNAVADKELIAKLEGAGMIVNEVDPAPFAEKLQALYAEYEEKVIGSELMNIYREYSGY